MVLSCVKFFSCVGGGGGQDKPAWAACPRGEDNQGGRVGKINRDSSPYDGGGGGKPTTADLPPCGKAVQGDTGTSAM